MRIGEFDTSTCSHHSIVSSLCCNNRGSCQRAQKYILNIVDIKNSNQFYYNTENYHITSYHDYITALEFNFLDAEGADNCRCI